MEDRAAVLARHGRQHREILVEERHDVRGRQPFGDRREAAHVGEQHRAGDARLADAFARAGRAAAGAELVQLDEVAGRVGEKKPPRFRAEPAVDDAIGHRQPVEFRLGLVDRHDREGQVRRGQVEFAGRQRVRGPPGQQVNLGWLARVDALTFARPVPGRRGRSRGPGRRCRSAAPRRRRRGRRDADREMVQFRDFERHVPGRVEDLDREFDLALFPRRQTADADDLARELGAARIADHDHDVVFPGARRRLARELRRTP